MAVMHYTANAVRVNNTLAQNDILAVRNAFLKYELNEQAKLLVKMPVSEAVVILHELPLRHVQRLLDMLNERGETACMGHLVRGLGLNSLTVDTADKVHSVKHDFLEHVRERIGWIVGLVVLSIASGLLFDFTTINAPWWF